MKDITYRPAAIKALRRMPNSDARRIVGKIEQFAVDPQSLANNVKHLQGREGLRLRVGDYRVIMLDGVILDILDVGQRGGIYR
jgi:mRNA interferase RelE/StbE